MTVITYSDGVTVAEDDPDLTLLQISLKHGIPHVHECGGYARCSTCRVMVHAGLENVLPRNGEERLLAERKAFEDNVRLACQTRVTGPVRIRRLVLDAKDVELVHSEPGGACAREQNLAILFSDVRDFTPLAEANLPYDVNHMLNRYFLAAGEAVLQNDGVIDKYIGDGMMALFGLSGGGPTEVCLRAVRAGLRILENLAELNGFLRRAFGVEFGTRIGIHFGEVVTGHIGHPSKMQFTAIGDAVNIASRIESAVKGTAASLLISAAVYEHVRDHVRLGVEVERELKGKQGTYRLYEVVGLRPVEEKPG
jgi:adenylate cyclase